MNFSCIFCIFQKKIWYAMKRECFNCDGLTAYFWFSNGRRIVRYIAISWTLYIVSVTWRTIKVNSAFFSLFLLRFNHWNGLGTRRRCCNERVRWDLSFAFGIHRFQSIRIWRPCVICKWTLPFPWFSILGVCTELLLFAADWLWPSNGNAFDSVEIFGLFWFDSCIVGVGTELGFVSSNGVGVRDRWADAVGVVPLLPWSAASLPESLSGAGCAGCCVADGVISPKPKYVPNKICREITRIRTRHNIAKQIKAYRTQRSIRMTIEKTVMMAKVSLDEYLVHAFVWVAVSRAVAVYRVVTRATAANPRPLSQLHVHDFDDISNHLHAYTFYYSLEIPIQIPNGEYSIWLFDFELFNSYHFNSPCSGHSNKTGEIAHGVAVFTFFDGICTFKSDCNRQTEYG